MMMMMGHLHKQFVWEALPRRRRRQQRRLRKHGRREHPSASSQCRRKWVVVLAFICCDHRGWILIGPLNSFLHRTLLSSAPVVASALVNIKKPELGLIRILINILLYANY